MPIAGGRAMPKRSRKPAVKPAVQPAKPIPVSPRLALDRVARMMDLIAYRQSLKQSKHRKSN
jgi:hypothetical protein